MINKSIGFLPINSIQDEFFVIPDYQRGYKWDKEQVQALLNDLHHHKEGKYCLQPVMVATKENIIEVIDGQQRLTTIYMILYYLENYFYFSLDYQTRKGTRTFLNEKMELLDSSVKDEIEWFSFTESVGKEFDNVDVFHIYTVYEAIHKWFDTRPELSLEGFINKIKNQVHIIWYDVTMNTDYRVAEDVFLNLNAGKIPLTNSELIKALFILDIQKRNPDEFGKLKSQELANEWDIIENKLHEDSFWYFICDHEFYNSIDTRIDLIIDLANGNQPKKDWDGKESYRKYEKAFLDDLPLDWNSIVQTFNKLNEWYEDSQEKELYHYIGFLINTKISSVKKIFDLSTGKTKKEFKAALLNEIRKELRKIKLQDNKEFRVYDLDNLDYKENRVACQNILLLLNVERYIKDLSHNKFPFDLYKKEKWSVEHINPQNPKDFKDVFSLLKWLKSYSNCLKNNKEEAVLYGDIEEFINLLEEVQDKSKTVSDLRLGSVQNQNLKQIEERITDLLELHKIGNLTLLDKNTNSKLSNRIYIEKRTELLRLFYDSRKEEVFIPENSRDVFTKNYSSKTENITDEIFSLEDMRNYKSHLQDQLLYYYQ
jgi:uncharacterized protein with ParB-like and HNH nuclease domain